MLPSITHSDRFHVAPSANGKRLTLVHLCGLRVAVDRSQVRLQSECCGCDLTLVMVRKTVNPLRAYSQASTHQCVKCGIDNFKEESELETTLIKASINLLQWDSKVASRWFDYYDVAPVEVILEQALLEETVGEIQAYLHG